MKAEVERFTVRAPTDLMSQVREYAAKLERGSPHASQNEIVVYLLRKGLAEATRPRKGSA